MSRRRRRVKVRWYWRTITWCIIVLIVAVLLVCRIYNGWRQKRRSLVLVIDTPYFVPTEDGRMSVTGFQDRWQTPVVWALAYRSCVLIDFDS